MNEHNDMRIKGFEPGPDVGAVLNDLFERVVSGELPEDRRQLLMAVGVDHDMESLPFE